MNEEQKRLKFLMNYGLLKEEMEVSEEFVNNNFQKQQNAISLEVGIDRENTEQHRFNLILNFSYFEDIPELAFFFNVTNKENSKVTSVPKTLYSRKDSIKYLPKELVGKKIFKEKILIMLNKLLEMEKQNKFFMETYETYQNDKQISYYLDIVRVIQERGYVIEKQGINDFKKYYWLFSQVGVKNENIMTEEEKKWKNFKGTGKGSEWIDKMDKLNEKLVLNMGKKNKTNE